MSVAATFSGRRSVGGPLATAGLGAGGAACLVAAGACTGAPAVAVGGVPFAGPAGALDASAKMTEPVDDTLYFAGEHTDTSGHWGTVHGALRSGLRAATQLQNAGN